MKVSHNEAMQSYNNAMGVPSKVGEYLQKLKQRFIGMNVSIGIPTISNVFEEKGNNHLMIPNNIVQKILKDGDYASEIEEDFRIFEKQMKRDTENESIRSSGFFVNLDGSYGAWDVAKNITPYDSTDLLRQGQQAREELRDEGLNEHVQKDFRKNFSKIVVIENGEISEKEILSRGRAMDMDYTFELWA